MSISLLNDANCVFTALLKIGSDDRLQPAPHTRITHKQNILLNITNNLSVNLVNNKQNIEQSNIFKKSVTQY